jgi:hypothetical protein
VKARHEVVNVGQLVTLEHELDIYPGDTQRADHALAGIAQPYAPVRWTPIVRQPEPLFKV